MVVFPGQRIITSHGNVVTVAFQRGDGTVMVYRNGVPVPATSRCDAWGWEHDQTLGLEAKAA